MEEFDVRSADAFRRDLEVGLLTFNLISAVMTLAALAANVPVLRLSFTQCLRRIRDTLAFGIPVWVAQHYDRPLDWLIERLSQCRLPARRRKDAHEPRAVRRRPAVFPALKGSRDDARHRLLAEVRAQVDRVANS
jgi:hypothetical protein